VRTCILPLTKPTRPDTEVLSQRSGSSSVCARHTYFLYFFHTVKYHGTYNQTHLTIRNSFLNPLFSLYFVCYSSSRSNAKERDRERLFNCHCDSTYPNPLNHPTCRQTPALLPRRAHQPPHHHHTHTSNSAPPRTERRCGDSPRRTPGQRTPFHPKPKQPHLNSLRSKPPSHLYLHLHLHRQPSQRKTSQTWYQPSS
jgi:hypothetical protein